MLRRSVRWILDWAMARVLPDGWKEWSTATLAGEVSPAADALSIRRLHETLGVLAAGLPDRYTLYHGVHWTAVDQGGSVFGEIDFIVMNPAGDLLLICQKSGLLDQTGAVITKRERGRVVDVRLQMARLVQTLQGKLVRRAGCEAVRLDYLLYCPDALVRDAEAAGLSADRVVDAACRDRLAERVMQILPAARPPAPVRSEAVPRQGLAARTETAQVTGSAQATAVGRFLRDMIALEPDVSALVGQAEALVTRVSGGLAHWARQLTLSPFRLRVQATAGSGKTQLALAEYAAAIERGDRVLYLCFNRPLADHFASIAPAGGEVMTFHGWCQHLLRQAGQPLPPPGAGRFEALEAQAQAWIQSHVGAGAAPSTQATASSVPVGVPLAQADVPRYDTIIIDEGQDFSQAWCDLVLSLARPQARVLWLDDPMQALYPRPPATLPGWAVLHASTNHRSPREVVDLLKALLPEEHPIESASPIARGGLELIAYSPAEGPAAGTREALRRCLAAGFRRQDIAVISFHGRTQSALLSLDALGPHSVRRFTGRHDLLDQPVYTEGGILFESVYRFKGQAAPAIVFTEIAFASLDPLTLRKLFVGMTRATIKLVLVAAAPAAELLEAALRRAQPGELPADGSRPEAAASLSRIQASSSV